MDVREGVGSGPGGAGVRGGAPPSQRLECTSAFLGAGEGRGGEGSERGVIDFATTIHLCYSNSKPRNKRKGKDIRKKGRILSLPLDSKEFTSSLLQCSSAGETKASKMLKNSRPHKMHNLF